MNISPELLRLLRDPIDLGSLELQENELVNRVAGRRYSIADSIPILVNHAELGPQNLKIQKMYGWMAKGFDLADRVGNLFTGNSIIKLRRLLAERLSLKPGCRCLYTSIGTGLDLPFISERVPLDQIELVGLDLSMPMLRQCQKKLLSHQRTSMLVQANAERLPFTDGSFDVVLHVGGINLFDRPALAVQEMSRVARPGALVFFADETKEVVRSQYQKWNPFTRGACSGISADFDPRQWVPAKARAVAYEAVWKGKGYFISFEAVN